MRSSRAKRSAHRGRRAISGAWCRAVLMSIDSGMAGLPQSRPWENDQSRVTMRPATPARLARSMRAVMSSRVPHQYTWKKVWGLLATTVSMAVEPKLDNPRAVPRAAGGLGDADLGLGVDHLHAGGRDHDRHRQVLAHDLDRLVTLGGLVGDGRDEAQLVEGGGVVVERLAGLGPALERAEHRRRQGLAGPLPGDLDGLEPLVRHLANLIDVGTGHGRHGHPSPKEVSDRRGPRSAP